MQGLYEHSGDGLEPAAAVPVQVRADDPISREGVKGQLGVRDDIRVVGDEDPCEVLILVVHRLDESCVRNIRRLRAQGIERVLLVVSEIDNGGLLAVVEAGVGGVVWRNDATAETLARSARTLADGNAALPPDITARLLTAVGRLQQQVLVPNGLTSSGLSGREIDVLRLVAEGCDTAEIAVRLSYSERTIKGILHDIKTRLHLRNRTHAVTYAMREGLL